MSERTDAPRSRLWDAPRRPPDRPMEMTGVDPRRFSQQLVPPTHRFTGTPEPGGTEDPRARRGLSLAASLRAGICVSMREREREIAPWQCGLVCVCVCVCSLVFFASECRRSVYSFLVSLFLGLFALLSLLLFSAPPLCSGCPLPPDCLGRLCRFYRLLGLGLHRAATFRLPRESIRTALLAMELQTPCFFACVFPGFLTSFLWSPLFSFVVFLPCLVRFLVSCLAIPMCPVRSVICLFVSLFSLYLCPCLSLSVFLCLFVAPPLVIYISVSLFLRLLVIRR